MSEHFFSGARITLSLWQHAFLGSLQVAPTAAAGNSKETFLSKAARENKAQMEALASELEKNGGEAVNEDGALDSARSGGDPSLQQSKKRKKKSKK